MIAVHGTVLAPAVSTEHNSPNSPANGGDWNGGTSEVINVSPWRNSGNVPQTVSVVVQDLVNCALNGQPTFIMNGVESIDSIHLLPGEEAQLHIPMSFPAEATGSSPTPYTFNVVPTWS